MSVGPEPYFKMLHLLIMVLRFKCFPVNAIHRILKSHRNAKAAGFYPVLGSFAIFIAERLMNNSFQMNLCEN